MGARAALRLAALVHDFGTQSTPFETSLTLTAPQRSAYDDGKLQVRVSDLPGPVTLRGQILPANVIYSDGLERGTTGNWSSSTP